MLPRTSKGKPKCLIAFQIRCCLLLGIPLVYYLFLYNSSDSGFKKRNSGIYNENDETSFESRHLLASYSEFKGKNCTRPAILEFPPDGFTRVQRKHGVVVIHFILAIFCFLTLANVCENYFVPAIKIMCTKFKMAEDVAGATFMAAASSSPELFINCVGTFVTEGDLGVGTVVGSAVFNVLAVPACCGLIAGKVVNLDWWAVSRECLMYSVAVVTLILTLQDDRVYWHEAIVLVCGYFLYIFAMYFNSGISNFFRSNICGLRKKHLFTEIMPLISKENCNGTIKANYTKISIEPEGILEMNGNSVIEFDQESNVSSVWSWPDDNITGPEKLLWLMTWPISFALWLTIPDCRKRPKLTALTFVMCVVWIGGVSYLVAWIITIIGDTLNIPDSVMGLTFLAAGTSVPEAVSSVIVTNQGFGAMGISNSIGSNTFDIMLCLGLPWLVKSLFYPSNPGQHWVVINSSGLSYSAVTLLSTLIALYVSLLLNKFRLDWKIGLVCTIIYASFLTLSTLIELNVFFPVNLPTCPH